MATNTVRLDDGVKEEAAAIANQMGLTFNSVVNILLRKFNAEKGFPFPVKLEQSEPRSVFDMNSDEFLFACRKAVAEREKNPTHEYTAYIDAKTGKIVKAYANGKLEYELDSDVSF